MCRPQSRDHRNQEQSQAQHDQSRRTACCVWEGSCLYPISTRTSQRFSMKEASAKILKFNKNRAPSIKTSSWSWKESEFSNVWCYPAHLPGTQTSRRFCWLLVGAVDPINYLRDSGCRIAFFNGQLDPTPPAWERRSKDGQALHTMMDLIASYKESNTDSISAIKIEIW